MTTTTTQGLVEAVREAGSLVTARFTENIRPANLTEIMDALAANNSPVMGYLGPELVRLYPGTGFVEEKFDTDEVPDGDWWVVDPVSGNWNTVHGLSDWSVCATLIHDREPVLTVTHAPSSAQTYTAVAGGGARLNGQPIRPSAKQDIAAASVATSQPEDVTQFPGMTRRIGESVTAVLERAFALRAGVPPITSITQVADGRMDAFWLYGQNLADSLAGVLIAREAGAVVTDVRGRPWTVDSDSLLVANPHLHPVMIDILS